MSSTARTTEERTTHANSMRLLANVRLVGQLNSDKDSVLRFTDHQCASESSSCRNAANDTALGIPWEFLEFHRNSASWWTRLTAYNVHTAVSATEALMLRRV